MRTWDYNGFAVGPVLTLLEHIFDPKICFFRENDFVGCVINRPDRPIIIKMLGKVVFNLFDLFSII